MTALSVVVGWVGGGGVCGWEGRRGSFSLNMRVVHTHSVSSLLKNIAKEEVARLVVGNGSGTCKASFAGDVPRMFSLIKNEGDRRH